MQSHRPEPQLVLAPGACACRIRVRAARAGRAACGRPDGPGPGASRGEQEAPEDVRAARRPHPMSSETREDRARRRREERASTVLDGARERGPTDGEPGDVLMISADAAASARLSPAGRPRARRACASPAPARRRGREGPRAARGGRGRPARPGSACGGGFRSTLPVCRSVGWSDGQNRRWKF